MNALANSRASSRSSCITATVPVSQPRTFLRCAGQESRDEKGQIKTNPPDILLTNYVMLELILARMDDQPLVRAAEGLSFLVLDELHAYSVRPAPIQRRRRDPAQRDDLALVGQTVCSGTVGFVPIGCVD